MRARRLCAAPAVLLGLLLLAPAAWAHPALVQSSPAAGELLERSPVRIGLSFSEEVVARGSKAQLRRLAGGPATVAVGTPVRRGRSAVGAPLPARLAAGVYELRWSVLGADGHVVGGTLRFAVARAGGAPPPGIELLGAAAGPAPRDGAEASEGAATVLARWAGLLAAALLVGGGLLRRRLKRLGDGDERWTRVALLALVLGLLSAVAGAIAATAPGAGGGLGLLVAGGNGQLALARLAVVVLGALLALRLGLAERRAGELALTSTGALALIALGVDGHVQALGGGEGLLAAALAAVHVLAAGVWAGGVLALVVLALPRDGEHALAAGDGVRALAPVAGLAVLALALTGVLAALREVDHTVFLRHTAYGQVIVAKSALLIGLCALGAWIALRGRPRAGLLRLDAFGVAGVLLLAAALAGLVQGRGQPLPAQRGNLLGGPATATAVAGDTLLHLAVAPALPGRNVVAALAAPAGRAAAAPATVTVRLREAGGSRRDVVARLRHGAGGTWSAPVSLPARGTWYAYADAAGVKATAPVALAIGDPEPFGPAPKEVVQTADLSGAGAERCRAQAQGLSIAIGYLNARGGVGGGGDKIALRTYDDGGDPARAARLVADARERGAVALAAPCGAGAAGALRAAGDLPAIVADPDVPIVAGPRIWRLAPDPRAEGVAIGQYIVEQGTEQRPKAPRSVAILPGRDAAARARLAGLREALARAGLRVSTITPGTLGDPAALARTIEADRRLAVVIDGVGGPALSRALRRVGERSPKLTPASIVVRSGLLDERVQEDAGPFGRLGVIQPASEVAVASRDALSYTTIAKGLFRGERPSIAGLRGFVAGRALAEGLRDGAGADEIAARLRRPRRFSDALNVPWRSDRPAAGAPLVSFLAPRFLPARLVPVAAGGESFAGTWFSDGSWQAAGTHLYGPQLPGASG